MTPCLSRIFLLIIILPWLLGSSELSFGFIPMNKCTDFSFYARIKPIMLHSLHMDPEEVSLGDYCPVTQASPTPGI